MKIEQRESYTEILTILNYMESEYKEKIPKELISFFERNREKDYKKLREQDKLYFSNFSIK